MFLWSREYPVSEAAKDSEVSQRITIDIEVCTNQLLPTTIILGGPGVIVQIDESLFQHKPKGLLTPKIHCLYNYSITEEDPPAVKCGCSDLLTPHTPALGYMEIVSQRDAATLLPIIQAHVAPGTIIHSDQWAAYNHRQSLDHVCGSYYPQSHQERRSST